MAGVEEPAAPSPRIGNAEREAAQHALDEHLRAGRLDAEEYGERSGQVSVARTVEDLTPLFADLPAPHPTPPAPEATRPHPSSGTAPEGPAAAPAVGDARGSALDRIGPAIMAALPMIALVLFFVVPIANAWVFFLLIPIGGIIVARTRGRRRDDA
jgi:DUF1707 SHOCT-like domain